MHVSEAVNLYRFGILSLSVQTQAWYATRLKQFVFWCEEHKLELEALKTVHIRQYIAYLQTRDSGRGGRLSTHTVHGHARAVRAFLNWCAHEDGLACLVAEKVAKRIGMPKLEERVIETLSDEQIKALFVACDQEYLPRLQWRDRAILSLLLDTGIRADELCGLTMEHCVLTPESSYVKVLGKGNKWREIGLGKKARAVIHRYIILYRKAPAGEQHVFLSRQNRPMTVNGLDQLLQRLGRWAHISGMRCSPHVFRHTFAMRYLLQGGDLFVLSLLLGHTSVQVTQRYLKSVKASQARAISKSVLDNL